MASIETEAIYTPAEAAELVGVKLTFIKTQIKEGRLTAYRLGAKVLRIKGSDLLAWFDGQRIPSASMGSCEPSRDGLPSGTKAVAERAAGSVSRSLRQ